jgi:hypothetical protein
VVSLCVRVLKNVRTALQTDPPKQPQSSSADISENIIDKDKDSITEEVSSIGEEKWSHEELERLLQFVAKIFMLQFPLYAGPKQAGLRNEEVSAAEATQMAVYCDVHDSTDFPASLLRNVSFFCKSGGLQVIEYFKFIRI